MSKKPHSRNHQKEVKEFDEEVLQIDRVTRVVKGGRRLRFRATVIIGNRKGKVGVGVGKSEEVVGAIQKAVADAKKNLATIIVDKTTIPHATKVKYKSARIILIPASEGTGIIAGGALRVVLEHAGIRNVLSKRYGTTNKLVNAQCTMKALMRIAGAKVSDAEDSKRKASQSVGGRSNKDLGLQDTPELEKVEIKEVSKADVGRDGGLEKKK